MFLQTKWEKERALGIFFSLPGLRFLISCYILYPGPYLQNPPNKKDHFSNKK